MSSCWHAEADENVDLATYVTSLAFVFGSLRHLRCTWAHTVNKTCTSWTHPTLISTSLSTHLHDQVLRDRFMGTVRPTVGLQCFSPLRLLASPHLGFRLSVSSYLDRGLDSACMIQRVNLPMPIADLWRFTYVHDAKGQYPTRSPPW